MAQVLPAANMLTRPVVPAASAPSAQPDVTKPLFPIAGQVKSFLSFFFYLSQHSDREEHYLLLLNLPSPV